MSIKLVTSDHTGKAMLPLLLSIPSLLQVSYVLAPVVPDEILEKVLGGIGFEAFLVFVVLSPAFAYCALRVSKGAGLSGWVRRFVIVVNVFALIWTPILILLVLSNR
jgi:hypothetical protein